MKMVATLILTDDGYGYLAVDKEGWCFFRMEEGVCAFGTPIEKKVVFSSSDKIPALKASQLVRVSHERLTHFLDETRRLVDLTKEHRAAFHWSPLSLM